MKSHLMLVSFFLLAVGLSACSSQDDGERQAEPAAAIVAETQDDPDAEKHLATCRAAAVTLGGALQAELQTAMQAGGPGGALAVCRTEAGAIARQVSDKQGLHVGRTSLGLRNPANAPDAWEQKGLVALTARLHAGEAPENLEEWALVTDTDGHQTFRYLKAIPTGSLCLACHGDPLSPDVSAQLMKFYPEDRGTGFAVGELRGAFTVALPVE
ncbi:MAG: DUF3365 domain-containing protein [bacterium]